VKGSPPTPSRSSAAPPEDASLHGRAPCRGGVENGSLWARIALVLVGLTLVFVLVPWRPATWVGAVLWGLTTLSLLAWTQAVTKAFVPPYVDRLAGFWLALGLSATVIVPLVVLLRETDRETGGEWLDR